MIGKFTIYNLQFTIKESGQALVSLLFFTIIAITIISAAIFMAITNATSTSKIQEGVDAYYIAESGIENALLRLLRDPSYAGENLTVGSGTVNIIVSGTNPKTVVATASAGNFTRTVQAEMNYSGGFYTFSNWREI